MLIYDFFYGLFVCGLGIIAPFSRKIRVGLFRRFGLGARILKISRLWKENPLWFHVASSGEFEQCLPILEKVRERTARPIFISYFSPSGERAVQLEAKRCKLRGESVPWDYADYSPFDFGWVVRPFLRRLSPSHFICIHREIWPGILWECRRQRVHTLLLAAHFSEKYRMNPLHKSWLKQFDFIGTVNEGTQSLLKKFLFHNDIEVLGDPRVDRVLSRRTHKIEWRKYFNTPVLVLGSIRSGDYRQLERQLPVLIELGYRLVVAPHEPNHAVLMKWERNFIGLDCRLRRWSEWKTDPDTKSHLLLDRVGELAELYQVASVVYVGGGFGPRVHNVLEPAAYGRPVITGPKISHSREALEMVVRRMGVTTITQGGDLPGLLVRLSKDPFAFGSSLNYLLEVAGASSNYADRLLGSPV